MEKQPNCAERVDASLAGCRETIRMMLNPDKDDVELIDDGTLDTVLKLDDREFRFSQDHVADYRSKDGELDLDEFVEDEWETIRDEAYEAFNEYGLSFDYVEPNTFNDQPEGFFRYQISWGGPSEEFRFYVNPDFSCHRIEFWFLDWWDGASRDITKDEVAQMLWQHFEAFAPSLIEAAQRTQRQVGALVNLQPNGGKEDE